jgi:hypothetical protein
MHSTYTVGEGDVVVSNIALLKRFYGDWNRAFRNGVDV